MNSPHGKVFKQTISNWFVKVIQMPYNNETMKVDLHSTQALGPSWALLKGVAIQALLDTKDWSRENTFTRFCFRNVEATVLKEAQSIF